MSGRCSVDRPHDAVRDPVGGVDRAVRVLEDHGDMAAIGEPVAAPAQGADGLALEPDLARVGLYTRASSRATVLLPLPLSPTSATISAAPDGEADVVDGVQRLLRPEAAQAEVLGDADDLEQRARRGPAPAVLRPGPGPGRPPLRRPGPTGRRGCRSRPARPGTAGTARPSPPRRTAGAGPRALGHGVGATRLEPAARRGRGHVRRRAGDAGERDLRPADRGERLEQGAGVRVPRRAEQRGGGAELGHLAGVHHQQAVGEVPHQRDVVGDEDRREPEPVLQLLDLPHQ